MTFKPRITFQFQHVFMAISLLMGIIYIRDIFLLHNNSLYNSIDYYDLIRKDGGVFSTIHHWLLELVPMLFRKLLVVFIILFIATRSEIKVHQIIVLFIFNLSVFHGELLTMEGFNFMYQILLFYSIFIFTKSAKLPVYSLSTLKVIIMLSYLFSFISKALTDYWVSLDALSLIINNEPLIQPFVRDFLSEQTNLNKVLTLAVMILELVYPFSVFSHKLLRVLFPFVIIFHISAAIMFGYYFFSLFFIGLNFILFSYTKNSPDNLIKLSSREPNISI